jgi:hypothetical protein
LWVIIQLVLTVAQGDGGVNPGGWKIDHRRSQLLELTPQGAEVLTAIYALSEEWSQRIITTLNPEQLVEIADALEEIGDIIETDEQHARK